MIMGIDHVQLAMPEGREEDAVAFFSGLLGLRRIDKPPRLAVRGGVWFALPDGRELHLGVERPFRPRDKAHPAFAVRSLDELARSLAGAGYPVRWDEELPDRRRFYSQDPFGNRLEFLEGR